LEVVSIPDMVFCNNTLLADPVTMYSETFVKDPAPPPDLIKNALFL
jgi:hypothetical protein